MRLALELYGLAETARQLSDEHDDSFITTALGEGFTLQVVPAGAQASLIERRCLALARAAKRASSRALPHLSRRRDGCLLNRTSREASVSFERDPIDQVLCVKFRGKQYNGLSQRLLCAPI